MSQIDLDIALTFWHQMRLDALCYASSDCLKAGNISKPHLTEQLQIKQVMPFLHYIPDAFFSL